MGHKKSQKQGPKNVACLFFCEKSKEKENSGFVEQNAKRNLKPQGLLPTAFPAIFRSECLIPAPRFFENALRPPIAKPHYPYKHRAKILHFLHQVRQKRQSDQKMTFKPYSLLAFRLQVSFRHLFGKSRNFSEGLLPIGLQPCEVTGGELNKKPEKSRNKAKQKKKFIECDDNAKAKQGEVTAFSSCENSENGLLWDKTSTVLAKLWRNQPMLRHSFANTVFLSPVPIVQSRLSPKKRSHKQLQSCDTQQKPSWLFCKSETLTEVKTMEIDERNAKALLRFIATPGNPTKSRLPAPIFRRLLLACSPHNFNDCLLIIGNYRSEENARLKAKRPLQNLLRFSFANYLRVSPARRMQCEQGEGFLGFAQKPFAPRLLQPVREDARKKRKGEQESESEGK